MHYSIPFLCVERGSVLVCGKIVVTETAEHPTCGGGGVGYVCDTSWTIKTAELRICVWGGGGCVCVAS